MTLPTSDPSLFYVVCVGGGISLCTHRDISGLQLEGLWQRGWGFILAQVETEIYLYPMLLLYHVLQDACPG